MPIFDKSGPLGQGPRTGRNLGKCGSLNPNSDSVSMDEKPRRRGMFRGRTVDDGAQNEMRGSGRRNGRRGGRGLGRGRGAGANN